MPITTTSHTAREYEEDVIDYDDDDLEAPSDLAETRDSKINTLDDEDLNRYNDSIVASEHLQDEQVPQTQQDAGTSDLVYEQAKSGTIWSTSTMLTQAPEIASALGLNNIGDAASSKVTANGVTYEVTWKIIDMETPNIDTNAANPSSADDHVNSPPTANTHAIHTTAPIFSAPKCKFGRLCTKLPHCPFLHTPMPKLCILVNTSQGCTRGVTCEFSHGAAGAKCTRSVTRKACANGVGCGFRHGDDEVETGNRVRMGMAPVDAPGPRGVKRGREGEDARIEKELRDNRVACGFQHGGARGGLQQRGRGGGRGRGRGGSGLRLGWRGG